MILLRTSIRSTCRAGTFLQKSGPSATQEPSALICHRFLKLIGAGQFHTFSFHRQSAIQPASPGDPTEQRSPPSERVLRLAEEITALTLLEVSDLTVIIRKRLGMPETPMMPMMGAMPMMPGGFGGQAAGGAPVEEKKVEEKTEFDVKLEKYDAAAKLKVIKEVRGITGLGLKESKDMVEQAPVVVKKGVSKDEANAILEKLKAVGASCALE